MTANDIHTLYGPSVVLLSTAIMGVCGGLGFSNTYYKVGRNQLPLEVWEAAH
ncbi:hypothetical protein L873DRAFT_1797232 [Choiromyces venosus 120613-1]|uniref:Uncharacterized protein n=1 Tax=Choiromyces venosus 120613-1 TaxID=1336337 RepID=A0A3N4K4U1_9PEZI|nr:hypothetical protein L873DRAFT_1797232 [Choiromyces venosus 120613-1]